LVNGFAFNIGGGNKKTLSKKGEFCN